MQEFLKFIGHGFCHQIPSRSFEAGGLLFPVCARDTGIYLGFLFSVLLIFILYSKHEKKPGDLPSLGYILLMALLVLPMAFDGLTSYFGLRATTNTIRYITGLCTGIALGSLIAPLLFAIRKDADLKQRIFAKPSLFVIQLALSLALGTAFLFGYPYLGVISPFFPVVAFLAILISITLVLLTLSKRFFPRHTYSHWLILLTICLILAFIEMAVFGALRELLVQSVLSGHDISDFLQ